MMDHGTVFRVLAITAGATFLGACGEDSLDVEVEGRVEAFVHDAPPAGSGSFDGVAAGDMHVSIRSTGGTWIDLGSPNGITVALQSTQTTTVHGESEAPAGQYDRVRLTLEDVDVTVESGSVVGGTTLQEDASVTVGATAPVVVERNVTAFTVSESGTATVVFDLNAESWLDAEVLQTGVVADAAVISSVSASVTGG